MNSVAVVRPRPDGSRRLRVLLADPDESLHPVYREPLSQDGFELATASNGVECVARLRKQPPDVLVLEPQLPWGGGEGILAIMGETPQLATVPVMVLTACRDHHVLDRVSRFPVSDYQLKPLAPDRLAGRLHAILAHPRLRFTLAEQNGRLECSISRRTGGRVYDLRVETVGGRVIVRGRSDSHYVKQLALAAVMEAFEASQSQSERIEMEIDVVPDDGWQSRQSAFPETRNNYYSNESAPANEPDFTNEPVFSNELAFTKEE
ncbi:MAG: response regulator transcription factor [Pirellulales bacterium]|nr:response regulator transcription factor [Pirellulales bacterium]